MAKQVSRANKQKTRNLPRPNKTGKRPYGSIRGHQLLRAMRSTGRKMSVITGPHERAALGRNSAINAKYEKIRGVRPSTAPRTPSKAPGHKSLNPVRASGKGKNPKGK